MPAGRPLESDNPVVENIRFALRKNGYPEKSVQLPFRPVYDNCKKHDTALADVLARLREDGVVGELVGNHILFRHPGASAPPPAAPPDSGPGGSLQDFAQRLFAQMTPEQVAELRQRMASLSDAEKEEMLKLYSHLFAPQSRG